jgi:arginine/lysine/ornithine decarboxylase
MNTPICDFVRAYAEKDPLRLHMPGHKGAGALGVEALDITEVPGADVLYAPEGIIAASEANAAAVFGSAKTLYSTEGSSLCIRAMLYLALLRSKALDRRPLILAGRNAHKTFLSAAALLDLDVEWLYPEDGASLLSCPIDAETLSRRLEELPEPPVAVYVTAPDYLGNRVDLAALAEVCHTRGVLLLADNAHGAYLKFMSTSQHPLDLGADLCCDSAHKTLPVLTGGAYLHVSKSAPRQLCDAAQRAMSLFAGTSPSYLILQSLDAVNPLLNSDYVNNVMSTSACVDALRADLGRDGWAPVGDEPWKLTLAPKARGYTGTEIAALLERQDIVCEFADPDYIVFMLTNRVMAAADRVLRAALSAIPARAPVTEAPPALCKHKYALSPREAMLAPAETLPVERALGRVLASPCVSCPPAVPILVCGEVIDDDAAAAFRYYGIDRVDVVAL